MCTPNNPLLNPILGTTTTQQPPNAYTLALGLNIPVSPSIIGGRQTILGGYSPTINKKRFDYKNELKNIEDTINTDFLQQTSSKKLIPEKSSMKINQGIYVDCACLIVDIRKSSDLTNYHRKPQLAKIYQTFISTVVMILQDEDNSAEIKIIGDGVQGFFNTNTKNAYENILTAVAKINAFTFLMNKKFIKKGLTPIATGIGVSTGTALMTKVGRGNYTDIVWIGDVVNDASKLCDIANKEVLPVGSLTNFNETQISTLSKKGFSR